MSGGLSIHCVDVASGRVATGLWVTLHRLGPDGEPLGIALADGLIGANGLLAHPALMSEAITAGGYEVRFAVGAFYRGQGAALPSPVEDHFDAAVRAIEAQAKRAPARTPRPKRGGGAS